MKDDTTHHEDAEVDPFGWNSYPLYNVRRERDHVDRLYTISSLASVGVAATASENNVANLLDELEALFGVIHRLAGEGIEIAELKEKREDKNRVAA